MSRPSASRNCRIRQAIEPRPLIARRPTDCFCASSYIDSSLYPVLCRQGEHRRRGHCHVCDGQWRASAATAKSECLAAHDGVGTEAARTNAGQYPANFADWKERNRGFKRLAAVRNAEMRVRAIQQKPPSAMSGHRAFPQTTRFRILARACRADPRGGQPGPLTGAIPALWMQCDLSPAMS